MELEGASYFMTYLLPAVLLSVVACFVTCSRFVDGVKEAPRDVRSEVALIEGVKNEMAEDVNKEALIEYEK